VNTYHPLRALACVCACLLVTTSVPAWAQMVVNDPVANAQHIINTAENAMSAVADVEAAATALDAYVRQGEQLANQAEQLAADLQNLAKLDVRNLADLFAALDQVGALVDRSLNLARRSVDLVRTYSEVYGVYGPNESSGPDYYVKRQTWSDHVDEAYRDNLSLRARLMALKSRLYTQIEALEQAAQGVDGHLAAVELQTKMDALAMAYRAIELELRIARMEREELEGLEARRTRQATRTRTLETFGRGMGTHEVAVPPVVLRGF